MQIRPKFPYINYKLLIILLLYNLIFFIKLINGLIFCIFMYYWDKYYSNCVEINKIRIMKNEWLEKFKCDWLNKDIDSILSLFSDDCVYLETPYQEIVNKDVLKREWEYIVDHEIKTLNFEVFSEVESKIAVEFKYEYILKWEERRFSWVYLIELKDWKCNYFYQVWE